MTGNEFRAIRKFNGISQQRVADKLGYSNRATIRLTEVKEFLPQRYVLLLCEWLKIDFNNENKLSEYLKNIPEMYFRI